MSRFQFRRVLNELELAPLVHNEQEWLALYEKFLVKIGGKLDVNYNVFCDTIYDMAKFEWRKPWLIKPFQIVNCCLYLFWY